MSRSHWLDWKPQNQKFEDSPQGEATKTTKTPETPKEGFFIVFVGTPQSESQNFQLEEPTPKNTECLRGQVPEVPKGSPLEVPAASRAALETPPIISGPASAEEPAGTEPKVEISREMLAEFQSVMDAYTEAGFKMKRISDGRKQPRGRTMDEWRCLEAQRMAAEHLCALPALPKHIQRREQGETAIYYTPEGPFEWNHSAKGFTGAFWAQISEETAKGAKIQVICWPHGNLIYSSDTDAASVPPKENPQ